MNTLGSSSDLPIMTIRTSEDVRFSTSSRRLSRLMSISQSSVEVYYGGSPVAVPFKWESQPGTPRVRFRETPLPPLTPPPSFLSNSPKIPTKENSKPKGGLLRAVLPKLTPSRKSSSPSSPASSESSSLFSPLSHSDSASSPLYSPRFGRQSCRKSFEEDGYDSPVSTLCFRISRRANSRPRACKQGA